MQKRQAKTNYTKTLLLVGAGLAQMGSIKVAHDLGCEVVAIDGNPEALGLKLADVGVAIDITDIENVIALAKEYSIDGAFSIASEVCCRTVAAVNQSLGLGGLSVEQVALATNKGAMRKKYLEYNIPGPAFYIINDTSDFKKAVGTVGLPAVIKPVDSSGSRGVSFIEDLDQIKPAYDRAVSYSKSRQVILEEFMEGTEVSVEAFIINGAINILTLSDKLRTSPPFLLDKEVIFPSAHASELQAEIKKRAIEGIKALELDNCPIHMELMLTPNGPKIVELAARGPGFKVYTDIIPHVTGVNVVEIQLRLLLKEHPRVSIRKNLKGACLRFWEGKNGRVKYILGVETMRNIAGVHDLDIYVKSGDVVRDLTCGADRIGHIIAFADTREEACAIASKAFNGVEIVIEP